jgi:hypothetical protein
MYLSLATLVWLLLSACTTEGQVSSPTQAATPTQRIEVLQFHSEHRCYTCNKIESHAKEALDQQKGVSFKLINVDDKKNASKAEKFEAAGTALFLYDPATGKKKDLTDFAFMNAGNKEKFITGLRKEISQFGKSSSK